jgi:hypothetical protein
LVRTHSAPFGCWDKPQATWTHLTHHGPDSGEATTFPLIVFSAALRRTCIQMAIFPGTPKVESRNCPGFGLPGLWASITSRPELGSGRGLNQSCSSRRELSNGVSHFTCTHRDWVDSRLLVVRSQTTNSFDHNLCYKCPNGSCEAILDIYTSRPFQWYKEHPQCKVFWPLQSSSEFSGVPEDSKFPLLGVWVSSSHLTQSGVAIEMEDNQDVIASISFLDFEDNNNKL